MAIPITSTAKFSVWSLAGEQSVEPDKAKNEYDVSDVSNDEKFEAVTEQKEEDLNQALTMLGGSFAMSMFAVNYSDEEDEISKNGNDNIDPSIPSGETLLYQCVDDGDVNAKLSDPHYWEELAEATAGLYPCDPLTVGNTLGYRSPAASNTKLDEKKIQNELDDKGYCVVNPETTNQKKVGTGVFGSGNSKVFDGQHLSSSLGGGFGGLDSTAGFTPGMLSSGSFGGDGLAFINDDEINVGSNTMFGMPSNEYDVMARAVRVVEDNGWPPVFALMYDQPWAAIQRAWSVAAKVLGDDCELEPSLFIWSLSRNIDIREQNNTTPSNNDPEEEKRCSRIGQNFGLPHRDFSYEESHFPDGTPRILNIWMPFTDVDVDNGCLWVVPREFDAHYDQPQAYEHSRPATPAFEKGCSKVRFPMGAARPITGEKGSAVLWHNIIHWGGNCGKNAQIPRISLAATFKAKNSTSTHLTSNGRLNAIFESMKCSLPSSSSSIDGVESEMSTSNRIKLIASALLMYSDWFDLEGSALPDDFYRLAGYPKPRPRSSEDGEFSAEPPISSNYQPSDSMGVKTSSPTFDNIITEEEFQEYKPNIEIVDV